MFPPLIPILVFVTVAFVAGDAERQRREAETRDLMARAKYRETDEALKRSLSTAMANNLLLLRAPIEEALEAESRARTASERIRREAALHAIERLRGVNEEADEAADLLNRWAMI